MNRRVRDYLLRFFIEEVGQVEGTYAPEDAPLAHDFLLRRTAGHGVELAGILAFHASPVWVMAALADLSGAGRVLVSEISEELKRQGMLEPGTKFENVDQILDGLEHTAGRLAETFNTPPLDVASLREEWAALRAEARRIPPRNRPSGETIRRNWEDLKAEASAQNRSVFELSSLIALAAMRKLPENVRWLSRCAGLAVRHTGHVFGAALLDHYTATLKEIRQAGYLAYLKREFSPYLRAAVRQFSPSRVSVTEKVLRRQAGHPYGMEPTQAERARTLAYLGRTGTLSTHSVKHPGWPFGSLMPYAVDSAGSPLFLISSMAVHSRNLAADPRASLLIAQPQAGEDPQAEPRLTLLGTVEPASGEEIEAARTAYLARHPAAASWVGFQDFSFHVLKPSAMYFVAGFGGMGWIAPGDYAEARPDPLADAALDLIYQINLHYGPSLARAAEAVAGGPVEAASVAAVDRLGFQVRYRAGGATHEERVPFPHEVRDAGEAKNVLLSLLRAGKSGAA